MKANDCRVVRQRLEELDLVRDPVAVDSIHLRQCDSCRAFYEREVKLRQIVASLPAVAAPADFDFRLRARIASERAGSGRAFKIGRLALAIPTVTVAALVLVILGVVTLPNLNSPENTPKIASEPVKEDSVPARTGQEIVSQPTGDQTASTVVDGNTGQKRLERTTFQARDIVSQKPRLVIKDSAVAGAPVMKQEEAFGESQLPVTLPVQTLKVSVDDGSGVSRTISFPTVSFGSQRVLTNAANPNAQAKVVW